MKGFLASDRRIQRSLRQVCLMGVAVHVWAWVVADKLILYVFHFVFSLVFVSKFNH